MKLKDEYNELETKVNSRYTELTESMPQDLEWGDSPEDEEAGDGCYDNGIQLVSESNGNPYFGYVMGINKDGGIHIKKDSYPYSDMWVKFSDIGDIWYKIFVNDLIEYRLRDNE